MVEICIISFFFKFRLICLALVVHFAMSLKSFPIIFINMGGEMVYILDQRLSAQNIDGQKAVKGTEEN